MREQHNVTFEPNLGPAFPVCAGPGTQGSAYGAAYGVPDAYAYGYGSGSGQRGQAPYGPYGLHGLNGLHSGAGWVEAAQAPIGAYDSRGKGCSRNMWPDRLGGVRFGACCPTEISFGRIMPEFTRAAMQAQEEANQKQMLQDARSAQQSEVESGEFSEYGIVSTEQSRNPDVLPHLSAEYGGYKDYGTFPGQGGHGGHGNGSGQQWNGYGSGQQWNGNGAGNGYGAGYGSGQQWNGGQFNGGRCAWR
jgi:hypothetical protein